MARAKNRLLDVLTRHQIYLEGVKVYQWYAFNAVLAELNRELKHLFASLRYDSFDIMTKAQLTLFLRELRKTQSRIYSEYYVEIIEQFKAFAVVERKVSKIIFATLALEADEITEVEPVETEEEADSVAGLLGFGTAILGLAVLKPTRDGMGRLWGAIANAPIPANGLQLEQFVRGFVTSAQKSIENIITKGYANKTPIKDVIAEIQGTIEANRRDGQLNRIFNQAGAVIDTVLQHTSSVIQAGIASQYYDRYMWVSVLDNRTTDICRSRNEKVYRYGEGPLPPAHVRCRSKTVPYDSDPGEPPKTFYAFAISQPIAVQNDILGPQKADAMRNGDLKASDMPKFDDAKALSPEQFANKTKLILKR